MGQGRADVGVKTEISSQWSVVSLSGLKIETWGTRTDCAVCIENEVLMTDN
jgi:hypothetical protein